MDIPTRSVQMTNLFSASWKAHPLKKEFRPEIFWSEFSIGKDFITMYTSLIGIVCLSLATKKKCRFGSLGLPDYPKDHYDPKDKEN